MQVGSRQPATFPCDLPDEPPFLTQAPGPPKPQKPSCVSSSGSERLRHLPSAGVGEDALRRAGVGARSPEFFAEDDARASVDRGAFRVQRCPEEEQHVS